MKKSPYLRRKFKKQRNEKHYQNVAIHAPYLTDKGQSNRKNPKKRHNDSTANGGTGRSIQTDHFQ